MPQGVSDRSRTRAEAKQLTVILREEDRGYSVQCVELPGAISEGKMKKEALENIREAIQGYSEAFPEEQPRLGLNEVVQVTI